MIDSPLEVITQDEEHGAITLADSIDVGLSQIIEQNDLVSMTQAGYVLGAAREVHFNYVALGWEHDFSGKMSAIAQSAWDRIESDYGAAHEKLVSSRFQFVAREVRELNKEFFSL